MSDVSGLARSSARLWQPVRMAPPPSSPSSIWWQGSVKKFTKKGGILVAYNRVKTEFIQERDGDWAAYFPSVLPWNPCQVLKDYHRPSWQCTFLCAPCLFKSHHSFDLLRQNLCEQVGWYNLPPCGSPRPWTPLPEAQPVANTPKIRL